MAGHFARVLLWVVVATAIWAAAGAVAVAQADLRGAHARALAEGTGIVNAGREAAAFTLALSAGVPWRVFTLDAPERLVVDLAETDLSALSGPDLSRSRHVRQVRLGLFRPGWSRIVLMLDGPQRVASAGLETQPGGGARLSIRLEPSTRAAFAAAAGAPPEALWPRLPEPPPHRTPGPGRILVALDPGHGGIDPGAERDGASEAALMLTFARELREVLVRSGRFDVLLTRDEDIFLPLQARVAIARAAGAAVLLSLHADALPEGRARGSSVYTLSADASDASAALLARSHDEADLLAGVELDQAGDRLAGVLMDLARTETDPRSERLAGHLLEGLEGAGARLHKRAHRRAGFGVLRAPDIPSALLELGFLSEARDLENLLDPDWRAGMAEGIRAGLEAWADEDAALVRLLRR